jgi:hypothetical protein
MIMLIFYGLVAFLLLELADYILLQKYHFEATKLAQTAFLIVISCALGTSFLPLTISGYLETVFVIFATSTVFAYAIRE